MLNKNIFCGLSIRKKIYKLAEIIRNIELSLKENDNIRTQNKLNELKTYIEYLKNDNNNKIIDARNLLIKLLDSNLSIKEVNFCFHNLHSIINETISEEYFVERSIKIFDSNKNSQKFNNIVILDNIRSPFNVGSIIRSCDCFGFSEILLCGITPSPNNNKKVKRTANGSDRHIAIRQFENIIDAINYAKNDKKLDIYALETVENSINLNNFNEHNNIAIIIGNEEFGISDEVFNLCKNFILIPTVGIKNSLNVANAFSILGYKLLENYLRNTNQ